MRKLLFTSLLFFCSLTIFNSCGPDEIPPHNPGWDWRIDRSKILIDPNEWMVRVGNLCPNYGDNCYKRPPQMNTYPNTRAAFINFKSYYDANNIRGFFQNSSNWNYLYPGLNINSDTIQNMMDGTWLTHISPDSAIIIYTGTLSSPDYRLGILLNLNVQQQE